MWHVGLCKAYHLVWVVGNKASRPDSLLPCASEQQEPLLQSFVFPSKKSSSQVTAGWAEDRVRVLSMYFCAFVILIQALLVLF